MSSMPFFEAWFALRADFAASWESLADCAVAPDIWDMVSEKLARRWILTGPLFPRISAMMKGVFLSAVLYCR